MGKSGSGILDGKSVSKIPKLKGIALSGSNDTSEDQKIFPALCPSREPIIQFQTLFKKTLISLANSTFQYISYKS